MKIIEKIINSKRGTKFWVEYPYWESFGYMVVDYYNTSEVVMRSTNKKTKLEVRILPIDANDDIVCPNDFLNVSIFPSKHNHDWDSF